MVKIVFPFLAIVYGLIQSEALASTSEHFYSVDSVVHSVTAADVATLRQIDIPAPEYLYHWISIKSLRSLLPKASSKSTFPLKTLNNSIFASYSPIFYGEQGLFTWHNPVGARTGGTNEVYGNGEALLAFKIRKSPLKIGLVVSAENHDAQRLVGPVPEFDLILHVNGYVQNGSLLPGIFEWIIINPAVIDSFTANPENIESEFKRYHRELVRIESKIEKSNLPPILKIAGEQHNDTDEYALTSAKVVEDYRKLLLFKSKIPKWLQRGWIANPNSCQRFYSGSTAI